MVAFITDGFLERGWPTAELNSSIVAHVKGKKRVLPIFVADRENIVRVYPLLDYTIGKRWSEGIPALVTELLRALTKYG